MTELEKYTRYLVAKHKADAGGRSREGNRHLDTAIAAFKVLSSESTNWAEQLSPLLEHPNETVRLWTAAILLDEGYPGAEEELEEMSTKRDIYGAIAETTLMEWRAGRLVPFWRDDNKS